MEIITQDEKIALEKKLEKRLAQRPVITNRISEARALGDLKENGEYHAAREDQGLNEAEIRRLEERLATAGVVDKSTCPEDMVFLGATVKMTEVATGETDVYRLVGEPTGDDDEIFEVTASSPMGESMMKSRLGEVIRVHTPRGVKQFEITEIL